MICYLLKLHTFNSKTMDHIYVKPIYGSGHRVLTPYLVMHSSVDHFDNLSCSYVHSSDRCPVNRCVTHLVIKQYLFLFYMRIFSLKTLTSGTAVSFFQSVITQTFRNAPMLIGVPFYLKSLYQHKYEVTQIPELPGVSACIVIIINIW
jgi:hypothetical protein